MNSIKLSPGSLTRFKRLVLAASKANGIVPMRSGGGSLMELKRHGLVATFASGFEKWLCITRDGGAFAEELGMDVGQLETH